MAFPRPDARDGALGEFLLHGVPPVFAERFHRMPLASLPQALLAFHAEPAGQAWAAGAALAAELGLVFSTAALLSNPWGGALAVWLWQDGLGDRGTGAGTYALYIPMVLGVALLAVWRARKPDAARSALLGAGLGASLLYRSALFLLPPLLALGRRGRPAALVAGLPYLILVPWAAFTWATGGEINFREQASGLHAHIVLAVRGFEEGGSDQRILARAPEDGRGVSGWALSELARDPRPFLAGAARRALWIAGAAPVLWALAALGLWLGRGDPAFRALGWVIAYFTGVHALVAAAGHYFLPLWPLLAAAGGAGLARAAASRFPALGREGPGRLPEAAALAWGLGAAALCAGAWLALARASGARPPDYAAAAARWPRDAWLRWQNGLSLAGRGDFSGAAAEFEAAAGRLPQARAEAAWALFESGRPDALLALPDDTPDLSEAFRPRLYKALACLSLGRAAEGREHLRAALERWLSVQRLRDSAGGEDPALRARAVEDFAGILIHDPRAAMKRPAARLAAARELARLHPEIGGLERIAALLAPAPDGPGKPPRTDVERILKQAEAEKPGKAIQTLEALLRERPDLTRGWLALAEFQLAEGRVEPAREALRRARPGPGSELRAAALHRRLGQLPQALALLREATARQPGSAAAWLELAHARLDAKDGAGALEALSRAEARAAAREELDRLWFLYQAAGKGEKALAVLETLVGRFPKDAGALKDRGVAEHRLGLAERARASFEAAAALDPKLWEAQASLGALALARGDREESRRRYRAAWDALPPDAEPALRRELRASAGLGSP